MPRRSPRGRKTQEGCILKPPPRTTPVRLNLAPMVDVTMCLLVFFMLTTRMVEQENNSTIDLPVALSARDAEKQELGKRFVINIRASDSGATYLVQEETLAYSEVLARLQNARRHDPDVNCVIRADRKLPYMYVQHVMSGCARANVQKVTFSANPREQGGR